MLSRKDLADDATFASKLLVDEAVAKGSSDNITALVVYFAYPETASTALSDVGAVGGFQSYMVSSRIRSCDSMTSMSGVGGDVVP